jgi:hypothetical protein
MLSTWEEEVGNNIARAKKYLFPIYPFPSKELKASGLIMNELSHT